MNQMLVGLWDVDEHPGEKLERPLRVVRLAVVDIVAGFGLINEETRLRMTGQEEDFSGRRVSQLVSWNRSLALHSRNS